MRIGPRTVVWLFTALWLCLTAYEAAGAFRLSTDPTVGAAVDWLVIAASLVAPIPLLHRVMADAREDTDVRGTAIRLILVAYVPLWTALRLLERSLLMH